MGIVVLLSFREIKTGLGGDEEGRERVAGNESSKEGEGVGGG